MALTVSTGTENYPPRWAVFDRYVSHVGGRSFDFATDGGEINRFATRYRAAKCFKQVEFDHLTRSTKDGYSALVRLLLTYSVKMCQGQFSRSSAIRKGVREHFCFKR